MLKLILLICFVNFSLINADFEKVDILPAGVTANVGDSVNCAAEPIDPAESVNDTIVYTVGRSGGAYQYYPIESGITCFSFDIKGAPSAWLALADTTYTTLGNPFEVGLEYGGVNYIRKNAGSVSTDLTKLKLITPDSFTRYWITFKGNTLNVGLGSDPKPFMTYTNVTPFDVKFIGVLSWYSRMQWIIHNGVDCSGAVPVVTPRTKPSTVCAAPTAV